MKVKVQAKVSRLRFKFPFKIAHGERTGTDVVYIKVQHEDMVAFGEATLPPYLPDKIEDVIRFVESDVVQSIRYPFDPAQVFNEMDAFFPGIMPAKAALDMALWNLKALLEKVPLEKVLNISVTKKIPHTYTIGIGDVEMMKKKLDHGLECGFRYFKLKLDGVNDEAIIRSYTDMSNYPFAVDANQAWSEIQKSNEMCVLLKESGCILVEQPFHRLDLHKTKSLRETAGIPLIADEACQRIHDLELVSSSFDGVNIKLQKCGGITEAYRMIEKARRLGLKVLIGCMSESSIGCNSAEVLSPICDWADLDGPWLIENDLEIMNELKLWGGTKQIN